MKEAPKVKVPPKGKGGPVPKGAPSPPPGASRLPGGQFQPWGGQAQHQRQPSPDHLPPRHLVAPSLQWGPRETQYPPPPGHLGPTTRPPRAPRGPRAPASTTTAPRLSPGGPATTTPPSITTSTVDTSSVLVTIHNSIHNSPKKVLQV